MEDVKAAIAPQANTFSFPIKPYQPKTFALSLDSTFIGIKFFSRGQAIGGSRILTIRNTSGAVPFAKFTLGSDEKVREIFVCGVDGRIVRSIVRGGLHAKTSQVSWDGLDAHGRSLASGIYFITVSTSGSMHSALVGMVR
jgi:hypothetical protein